MARTSSLKKPVPFHRRRAILGSFLVIGALVFLALRGENTRTQLGHIKGNIANRCVAGAAAPRGSSERQDADNACRKLLSRLLDVSKSPQRQQLVKIIKRATSTGQPLGVSVGGKTGGTVNPGNNSPSTGSQGPSGPVGPQGPAGGPGATVPSPTPVPTPTVPQLPKLPLPDLPKQTCITLPNTPPVCVNINQ